jgi:predicted  nucleic acid-binding Zn-ribbon protein
MSGDIIATIGTGAGVAGLLLVQLRQQFNALGQRIDDVNRRLDDLRDSLIALMNARFTTVDVKFAKADERQDRVAAEIKEAIANKLLEHTEAKH